MTQEDKDLLLKYLCMALPYGVICNDNRHGSGRVTNIDITPDDIEHKNSKVVVYYFDFDECGELKNCKPYLRSMDSMTDDEEEELRLLKNQLVDCNENNDEKFYGIISEIDNLYLSHHIDFMGLIPKNLAIEITKTNNPYKD